MVFAAASGGRRMEPTRKRAVSVASALVHELREEKVTFIAGSIAYHAFVSLLPLLVLVLAVLSTVGNPPEEVFVDLAGAVLTENASEALLTQLTAAEATSGVSLLGGVVLVWGALRIFRGLDTAFSAIYDTESRNSIGDQFGDAAVVFVTFGLAIGAAWGIEGLLTALGGGPAAWLVERVVLVCGLSVTLFPMYYIFPDADVSVRETLPGLAVAAGGLVAFVSVFQFYAAYKASDGGSVIVGILVLLTWLYFSGLIVLVGAAVNAVLSNRSRDVDIAPVVGAYTETIDHSRLVAELEKVAASADGGTELLVTSDGSEIHLQAPHRTTVETDETDGDDATDVGIELRWLPEERVKR
jgi:membrane protein